MLFTSGIYFLFLVSVLIIYYLLQARYRNYLLLAASVFFYMYVKVEYLFIVFTLVAANYFIGIKIEETTNRKIQKQYLSVSLIINIGVLVFFKYLGFIIDSFFRLVHYSDASSNGFFSNIVLPLGLSYYTFQTIGYILDIYRGALKAERNIFRFALFTLFFPKLLVGPIERGRRLLPQLSKNVSFDENNLVEGGKRIAWGLFKKLVVADRISLYQTVVDANPQEQGGLTLLFASILYTFQVYADFSGYADIAIGSARLFGFNLMENFNQPLLARNLSDFWRRWHISLSSWVNDYIFNPVMYTNRKWGSWGVFYALFISFIVIGIWHGAAWNYVLFGVLQAAALSYETVTKKARSRIARKIPKVVYNNASIFLTFLFVTFSLIIFRSPTLTKAVTIVKGIFSSPGTLFIDSASTILFILIGCAIMLLRDMQKEYSVFRLPRLSSKNWVVQNLVYALLLIYILIAAVFDGGQFIYFSF